MSSETGDSMKIAGGAGVYNLQLDFWEMYRAGRPQIPASFYQRLYDYHAKHGGTFGTVHDVGAGFGDLSLQLAKKFDHVIVSDPGEQTQDVAKQVLIEGCGSLDQFTFLREHIEKSTVAPGSVDAIVCCNAIHWMNLDEAVRVMATQLKPHGTLFICLNGVLRFSDQKMELAWLRIMDDFISDAVPKMKHRVDLLRPLSIQDAGYDCVPLPESEFEPGAVRLKLNMQGNPDAFRIAPETSRNVVADSRLGPHDQSLEETDPDWFFRPNINSLRATLMSYPVEQDPDKVEWHLSELLHLMHDGTCEAHWPVSIIMATRKS